MSTHNIGFYRTIYILKLLNLNHERLMFDLGFESIDLVFVLFLKSLLHLLSMIDDKKCGLPHHRV